MNIQQGTWMRIKKFGLTALLTGVASISLAACGGDTAPPTQAPSPTDAPAAVKTGGQQVGVKLSEWAILPNNLTVPSGQVTFVVGNDGKYPHNLAVQSNGTNLGKTPDFKKEEGNKNLELDLQPGTYTLICTLPGHADKGMKGTLTVGK